jgi:hypothetical protein
VSRAPDVEQLRGLSLSPSINVAVLSPDAVLSWHIDPEIPDGEARDI